MLRAFPISSRQAKLILSAQVVAEKAQRELDLVVTAVLSGHDVEGQVVSVDTDLNVLNVEIPDIAPADGAA